MRVRLVVILVGFASLVPVTLAPAAAVEPAFAAIEPGRLADLHEDVLVQVVFVGYEQDQVDATTFLAKMPSEYRPIVRSRLWYDVVEPLGITYDFTYDVTYTDDAWEDGFFSALAGIGTPSPLTAFQKKYNAQERNVLDVDAGNNLFIDAPATEQLLIDTAPPGVDTERNTVFFINWWGRDDFAFHVYTKTGEPDPDTGYEFGLERGSRKIIAWGGTTPDDEETGLGGGRGINRVWFYDLSAGPEAWTANWVVDRRNLYGSKKVEYRMPPIWEYDDQGFRAPGTITTDLAKVARYVAIDLLFTTSPLYPPALTPPGLPDSVSLDLNTVEGWPEPGVDPSVAFNDVALLLQELGELDPLITAADAETLAFSGKTKGCFVKWGNGTPCYPARSQYPPFGNLFLDTALHRDDLVDGDPGYEGVLMNYATSDALNQSGLLGYADDNYIDGTQSFVFNFVTPGIVEDYGYGLTTTQIHEFGHHLALSHPHDGYDSEDERNFGPNGSRFFAWSGDQVNSIMSYIDLNWDFSQFDRDNFARFRTAAYLTNANAVAEDVLASPGAGAAAAQLSLADAEAAAAESAFAGHDYPAARDHARLAFEHVLQAAALAGVTVESSPNGWIVLPPPTGDDGIGKPRYAYVDVYSRFNRRALP